MADTLFKNFAMMIPIGPVTTPKGKPKPSKWKRLACFIVGHNWKNIMVTIYSKTMPERCERCNKERWLSKPNWRRVAIGAAQKAIDKLLRPLCYVGLHRWIVSFAYRFYCYGPNCDNTKSTPVSYSCTCIRCKKTKVFSK